MPRKKVIAAAAPAAKPLFVPSVDELKRRMAKKPATPKVTVVEPVALRLRFGTGEEDGFTKMGQVWESQVFVPSPWRLDDKNLRAGSVDIVFFAWYLHRLSQSERFITMDEAYRVLRPGGQVMIVSPYWSSRRAVADPLALWPPVCEESFYVYSKAWRESEGIAPMVGLKCDFASVTPQGQLVVPSGHVPDPEVGPRSEDYRQHASRHFINAVWELHVTLTKAGEKS